VVAVQICPPRQAHAPATVLPRSIVVVGGRKRWWPTAEMSGTQTAEGTRSFLRTRRIGGKLLLE
jgi:hypothetical protein